MGYKERARYLDPDVTDYVFDADGNATSTILVDGRAAGVWDASESYLPDDADLTRMTEAVTRQRTGER